MNFGSSSPLSDALSYPKTRPQYDLNLIRNKFIPPEYTFTRNSAGTYVGADGFIKTAAANEPRFDYDPATGEFKKGLLVEESRTNLLTYSEDFSNFIWTKQQATVTTNTIIAPDGTLTADKLVEDSSNNSHTINQPVTGTGNQSYSFSVYIKAGERTHVRFQIQLASDATQWEFNLTTLAVSNTYSAWTGHTAICIDVGNGWRRCILSGQSPNNGSTALRGIIQLSNGSNNSYQGDGTSGVYIWGAQLEAGSFPSSYIPTSGSAVTRQPDQLVLNRPFNSLGTFFVESNKTLGTTLSADNGTSSILMNSTGKEALYYNTNRTLVMSSDSIPTLFNIPAPQNLNRVSLGFDRLSNSSYINGHLKKFMYYGSPVTEDNLRSLTGNTLNTFRYNNDIVTNGLVLNLDAGNRASYPGSGTTWFDLSGNGNNGTLVNGPTFSSNNGGNIVFDGSNNTYNLGSFTLGATSSFTICCWFKRNILSSMNNKYLLRMGTLGGRIWFGLIDESNVYGTIYNNTYDGASGDYWQLVTNTFTNTNWCELILTHDKTNLVQRSYLNGVQAPSINLSSSFNNATSTFSSTQINASVSNLKIYNRALTPQEIQQNFNALRGRFGI